MRCRSAVSCSAAPAFEFYQLDASDNTGRFINTAPANGLDPLTLFAKQSYAGGMLAFNVDTRSNPIVSNKGINWNTTVKVLSGLNDESGDVTQLRSDFAFFLPLGKNIVLASRFGAGKSFGDFEFFQAQYLGGTDNLRGYRKFRFAGETMAYNNTELRIRLGNFKSYLFPGYI
jgi:outer membrane protein assembly factor BamA